MNQYQSTLYQLTESVGAVSMVNVDQIKRHQNLDYLEHLCSFIDRMNINPIWFENEDHLNKLKILEIYQLGITYSNNLSESYQKTITEKQAELKSLRELEKQKTRVIRNHKDDYQTLKERYKLKKHQLYKYMYDNLRNKMREEDSFRDTRRDHRDQRSEAATPQIVYYYPNSNDPMRYDPQAYQQYPPYGNVIPHQPYDPRMWPPNQPQSHQPHHSPIYSPNVLDEQNLRYPNPYLPPDGTNQPPRHIIDSHSAKPPGDATNQLFKNFLQSGNTSQPQEKLQFLATQSKVMSPTNNKNNSTHKRVSSSEKQKEDAMEKSHIITSGEKLYEKIQKQAKEKSISVSKDSGAKKKESIRVQSRADSNWDDDDFGNLTVNSKKKDDSVKLAKKDSFSSHEQEQYDSIAHIKLGNDTSSNKQISQANNPNRFQSKIYGKQQKQIKPPTPTNVASKTDSTMQKKSSVNNNSSDSSISIMQSNFSKNNKGAEGDKLFDGKRPERNSQNNKLSTYKSQVSSQEDKITTDLRQSNQSTKKTQIQQNSKQSEKIFSGKPKRNNQSPPKPAELTLPTEKNVETTEKIQKSCDIFQSNVGKTDSKKYDNSKSESIDIYTSNLGNGSNNSKKSEAEKLFSQKPKRASQIQFDSHEPSPTVTPSPMPTPNLEVPDVRKSNNNHLKISIAESEQMRNSNMVYSQANSMKFSKDPTKTPPKLDKQIEEDQNYEEDFDDFDDIHNLENSHLPISQHKPANKLPDKSEVNIDISAIPTVKQIHKEKFAKLPNQTFELKAQNNLAPNKNAASSNLNDSDNFLDEILQMPMNSRIAKRPSIHKFGGASSVTPQSVDSMRQLIDSSSGNLGSAGTIRSPSIHVIDPAGHMERHQYQRNDKVLQKQPAKPEQPQLFAQFANEKERLNTSRSSNLGDFNTDSKMLLGKQTSLLDQNKHAEKVDKVKTESDEDEINFNLMEESRVSPSNKIAKKQELKKLQALVSKLETQAPQYTDAREFDERWFDKVFQENLKVKARDINTVQGWEDVEKYYRKQYEKVKTILDEMNKQERSQNVSTPKSNQRESHYDDLQYSQSNVKIENRNSNQEAKKPSSLDPIKDMTESITIKDPPKIQQRTTPKNIQNKYSRSNKPKAEIKSELSKNINEGKNAYDVDDPLNVAAFQNKRLLEEQEDSEFD